MTSQEFEAFFAENSSRTVEELREEGYVVLVCTCSDEKCLGFVCMLKDQADFYLEHLDWMYGYRYPEEGE